eukprot:CAMPEP_0119571464 /NCGR_PEP_ID=MMETSP1352-20130426/44134_1 /TAXON_ID=265584 /ORGANISM="Stauroneis constricta, Strain CCMP1120" /LENGTH=551 /DNA_ID=CAMNT_0007621145 /DNA_START=144 /DNA_END=1799 /DNA_ORIENTATION=-
MTQRKQDGERTNDSLMNADENDGTGDISIGYQETARLALSHSSVGSSDDAIGSDDNDGTDYNVITMDDAIERLGMGTFQLRVLAAAGLCFAADAMQVLLLSFLSQVLQIDWNLSDAETASITSCLFGGAMVGTMVLGPYADVRGRRPAFFVASITITSFGIGVAFVQNYVSLLIMYTMVGFGVGGLTVPFDILAELLPAASRGKNLLLIEYFWTAGVLLVVLFAYLTLGSEHGDNWRLLVALSAIPCMVSVLFGYLFVPESPRWLATQGRSTEAMDILRNAAIINGHADPQELFPLDMQIEEEEEESSHFADLFKPKWLTTILYLWGTWGFFAFGYYGTILAITAIFASDSNSENGDDDIPDVAEFDYGAIFVSNSAEFIGTTIAILLVDRAGRIPLQIASYLLAGIGVCMLCVLADRGYSRDVLIGFGFLARIFEMSGSCVTWVSTAEILTTEVRTTGHSSANAIARIGALISPFVVEDSISLVKLGMVMLVVHTATAIFVSQLPETAGGRMGGGVVDSNDVAVSTPDEMSASEEDTAAGSVAASMPEFT